MTKTISIDRSLLHNQSFFCFVTVFALTAIYILAQPPTELLYDSADYWKRGATFFSHGYFNFLNYDASTARNFIFPLILGTISYCAGACHLEPLRVAQVINVGLFSLFTTIVVPKIVSELCQYKPQAFQTLSFAGIFFFFWHGFLRYSLTDFFALESTAVGCLLFLQSRRDLRFGQIALAFVCLGLAAMSRPAYILCLPLVPLAFLLTAKRVWLQWRNLLTFFVSGVLVVALMMAPQIYLNHVKPYKSNFSGANLAMFQLAFGIAWEKYETTSGNDLGGEPRVIYTDHIGAEIYDREHLVAPFDFSKFRRVVRKYPIELVAIYGKHMFNGFDIQFSEPYPAKIFGNRLPFSFLNYTILFIGLAYLFCLFDVKKNIAPFLYVSALLSPILIALPGAVEPRFFLPGFSFLYAIVAFAVIGNKKVYQNALKSPRTYLAYAGSMWLAITLSGATMANMYPFTPLFSGVPAPLTRLQNK